MKTAAAVKFFGNHAEVSRLLGLHRSASHQWGEVVPLHRAVFLSGYSYGRLQVDWTLYDRGGEVKAIYRKKAQPARRRGGATGSR